MSGDCGENVLILPLKHRPNEEAGEGWEESGDMPLFHANQWLESCGPTNY